MSSSVDTHSEQSSSQRVDVILRDLGYPPLRDIAGRLSIADLHASKSKRCGIYVIEHADGMHYVGQAVDVVRRFVQHRRINDDMVRFSFFQVARSQLDEEERRCISGAEARGLRLRNRMLVKQLLVESDLDEVLPTEEQQRWLAEPTSFRDEKRLPLDSDHAQRLRFRPQFERMQRDPAFHKVVDLLRLYVNACVPVPRRTELSFWGVSCLPSTNHSHHPRWASVNIAEMEVFVVGWLPEDREPWAFVNVSRSAYDSRLAERLARMGVVCEEEQRFYRAAAGDDLHVSTGADTFTAMSKALQTPKLALAARRLNLQVMRKRPNWYSKYHCFDLADCLL